jgi:hypothetical protein
MRRLNSADCQSTLQTAESAGSVVTPRVVGMRGTTRTRARGICGPFCGDDLAKCAKAGLRPRRSFPLISKSSLSLSMTLLERGSSFPDRIQRTCCLSPRPFCDQDHAGHSHWSIERRDHGSFRTPERRTSRTSDCALAPQLPGRAGIPLPTARAGRDRCPYAPCATMLRSLRLHGRGLAIKRGTTDVAETPVAEPVLGTASVKPRFNRSNSRAPVERRIHGGRYAAGPALGGRKKTPSRRLA